MWRTSSARQKLLPSTRRLPGPRLMVVRPLSGIAGFAMDAFTKLFGNPKTTRSQCIGGMIGGIGMALMEHSVVDARNGRVPNANFAKYAVPVHADAPPLMDVIFVEEHDPHVNPLGVKGVGEIAMVGVAPAIASAIFHATGKRIRELPITPEKLL